MKVETNLKAGNLINDAVGYTRQTVDSVTGFVASANQEANSVVGTVNNATNSAWKAVTGIFS
jgi:hypothetical protein